VVIPFARASFQLHCTDNLLSVIVVSLPISLHLCRVCRLEIFASMHSGSWAYPFGELRRLARGGITSRQFQFLTRRRRLNNGGLRETIDLRGRGTCLHHATSGPTGRVHKGGWGHGGLEPSPIWPVCQKIFRKCAVLKRNL